MSTDVTKDLLDALKGLMALSDHRVDLRDQAKAARSAIAAAEAQQERLLQDMHDAGREVERAMSEPTPRAVRLTEAEVAAALNLFPQPSSLVLKITRAIETAVLRKNGIEVAE